MADHAGDDGAERPVVAFLALCSVIAWGCGGNVAGKGTADGSSGSGDGGSNLGAGGRVFVLDDAETRTDATFCSIVLASDYDQFCTVDTDCVAVGQVTSCPIGCDITCAFWAINKAAMPQYMAVLLAEPAPSDLCNCDVLVNYGPCCRTGICRRACSATTDTLPACADAGGTCVPRGPGTTCGNQALGLPDACAYSDEICCLN